MLWRLCLERLPRFILYDDVSAAIGLIWSPHQLRPTATTWAAKEFGIEIAKAATGHAHISTTQIYAERDLDVAKKVALKFG